MVEFLLLFEISDNLELDRFSYVLSHFINEGANGGSEMWDNLPKVMKLT